MIQSLPYAGFRLMSREEIDGIYISSSYDDAAEGILLEVDLEYPRGLHDRHASLPLCFESRKQTQDVKLMATLHDKERHVIHYRMLKKALELGLKLKKIHRAALQFRQSRWLEPYIMRNIKWQRT